MTHFFQTVMGRKFYEVDVVHIKKGIETIGQELAISNQIKEREIVLLEKAEFLKECELKTMTKILFAKEKANELKERELKLKEQELDLKAREIEITKMIHYRSV